MVTEQVFELLSCHGYAKCSAAYRAERDPETSRVNSTYWADEKMLVSTSKHLGKAQTCLSHKARLGTEPYHWKGTCNFHRASAQSRMGSPVP